MRNKNDIGIFVLVLTAISFSVGQSVDGGMVVNGLPNNALTAQEQADGYQLLWNGKDFSGWLLNTSTTNPSPPTAAANWSIVTLKGLESNDTHESTDPDSNILEVASSGASLFTSDSTYLNFDWKMEWQTVVGLQGNSGMLIRYRNSVNTNNNYSAPEYQLCNLEWASEWKTLLTTAGADYDMLPLLPSRRNPDLSPSWCRAEGHWNQSRIISFGAHTAHYGNGLRLMEYQMLTPVWNAAYNASKYKGLGVYNTVHSGSFYIQDHGEKWMKFRNLRVKRLTQNPWGPDSPYLNKDSAAIGDSVLIDTLTFADDLFPAATAVSPNTIVPKDATKINATRDGLSILFSEPGDYSLSLEDVRGFRFATYQVHHSNWFFVSGRFSHSPRILTIWKGDKKIQEKIIGVK